MICKIFKTLELCFLWSFGRHKPVAGGFCLDLSLIIRGVSRGEVKFLGNPSHAGEGCGASQEEIDGGGMNATHVLWAGRWSGWCQRFASYPSRRREGWGTRALGLVKGGPPALIRQIRLTLFGGRRSTVSSSRQVIPRRRTRFQEERVRSPTRFRIVRTYLSQSAL